MGYRAISAWCPLMTSLVLLLVFSDWGAVGACPRAKALEEPQPWYGGASVFLISEVVECVDYELVPLQVEWKFEGEEAKYIRYYLGSLHLFLFLLF